MDTRFVRADTAKLPPADSYDVAIAAIFVRVADRKGSVGLPDDEAAIVEPSARCGEARHRRLFWQPDIWPNASCREVLGRRLQHCRCSSARRRPALFGQVPIGGRLP